MERSEMFRERNEWPSTAGGLPAEERSGYMELCEVGRVHLALGDLCFQQITKNHGAEDLARRPLGSSFMYIGAQQGDPRRKPANAVCRLRLCVRGQ